MGYLMIDSAMKPHGQPWRKLCHIALRIEAQAQHVAIVIHRDAQHVEAEQVDMACRVSGRSPAFRDASSGTEPAAADLVVLGRSSRHGSSPAPLQRAGGGIVEAQRRPNESEMRKGLREISNLPPRVGNILFSKQANIIANCHQAFEQGMCIGIAPLQNVSVG
jgi:hypothetical protein